jgi:hypothetical protein
VFPDELQIFLVQMFLFALALLPSPLLPLHSALGAPFFVHVLIDNETLLNL